MMHQPRRQQLTADLWAKAGELEKQFASYKKKVEKSDQAKDESTPREKRDGGRGEYYERYMRIRDVKLRQQLSLRIERKQSEMTAMWEQLEKSRVEMTLRFGGGAVGRVAPVRTPSPSAPKKTVQLKREFSDEKKGQNVTPRSTNTSSKRHGTASQITPSSSQSSTTRASTLPQSPKRSNMNSTNQTRSVPRLKSPARSAGIFSDLRKENKTPVTPRTRVLTKSQSLVLEKSNSRGTPQKKVPQTVKISSRFNEIGATIESKEDDQMTPTALEETPQATIDTFFEPVITIEDDILPKLQETLTEIVLNKKIEEEIPSVRSNSSHEMLDHENNNNDDTTNIIEPDIANYSHIESITVSDINSILNPAIDDDDESSGGSSRSWCSNFETSFSRSTVDPAIDSPILSPRGGGSTSFRFLPEPSTIRVRKKWESRSINSPRGIKRFLSFGKKNKGSEILATDMISPHAGLSSIFMDDESDNTSNVINQMSLVSYESNGSRNDIESENGDRLSVCQQAHALTGSLASSGAKFDHKEDLLSANSQKSHRSFFSFPPFLNFQRS